MKNWNQVKLKPFESKHKYFYLTDTHLPNCKYWHSEDLRAALSNVISGLRQQQFCAAGTQFPRFRRLKRASSFLSPFYFTQSDLHSDHLPLLLQEVVKGIQEAQGVKHLVAMTTSEQVAMQNEALSALAAASAINLGTLLLKPPICARY